MSGVGHEPHIRLETLAAGNVRLQPRTPSPIVRTGISKVNVFTAAGLAGIMAAKHVDGLIPLCHPYSILSFASPLPAGRRI
jgi:cyclic pyranopterin phosphate synthase